MKRPIHVYIFVKVFSKGSPFLINKIVITKEFNRFIDFMIISH